MSDDKPPERPTVNIEKPPAWAIALMERVQQGFATTETRFDRTDANIEVVSNDLKVTKDRVALLEARADTSSLRVRGVSEADLEQASQLAQERAAREALAAKVDTIDAKTDTLTAVNQQQLTLLSGLRDDAKKFLAHPAVKYAAAAIWTAIVAYAARKGISLQ